MEFNKEKFKRKLLDEFVKLDEFQKHFTGVFIPSFKPVITELYSTPITNQIKEFLQLMANETISFTEAVIAKDLSYPEYRKQEELDSLSSFLTKQNPAPVQQKEIQKIKYILNSLILKHYPAIYDLSSFGYRLLDRYTQLLTLQFITGIKKELSNQQ